MKERIQEIFLVIVGLPIIRHVLKFIIGPIYHARGARVLYEMVNRLLEWPNIDCVKVYKCKACHKIAASTGDSQIEFCGGCQIYKKEVVDAFRSLRTRVGGGG